MEEVFVVMLCLNFVLALALIFLGARREKQRKEHAEMLHENLEKHLSSLYDKLSILTDFGEQLADPNSLENRKRARSSYDGFVGDSIL